MNTKRLKCLLLITTVFLQITVWSQISMSFSPAIHGKTIDGLSNLQIINSTQSKLEGYVIIRVNDLSQKNIVTITTPPFTIRQGANLMPKQNYMNSRFVFANDQSSHTVENTGRFPEADLEYCFEVNTVDEKNGGEVFVHCSVFRNQPMTPLLLVNPLDGEQICNVRPNLVWQPPMPMTKGMRFRLLLVAIKDGQEPIEALANNQPIINQSNLSGNNLPYPPSAPDLVTGTRYAWQVIAYEGNAFLSKSEIWTFIAKCWDEKKKVEVDSYRELKATSDGSYYIADRILRFSFNNPYNQGKLNYSIKGVSKPETRFKSLPELKSFPGLNKYDLDLTEISGFENDNQYIITVFLSNGKELILPFTYKNE